MENDIKQVIVVRKDLNLKKSKLAAYVSHASMKFLLENNESERGDEFTIKLSPEEAVWLKEGSSPLIFGINSETALRDMLFRAELDGIEVYPLFVESKEDFGGEKTLVCAAFGPSSFGEFTKIVSKLKSI
jgi:PTH2 family peptidyl-tRNA hydrolase